MAVAVIGEQPVGNTHVIIFTDGVEAQSRREIEAEAIPRAALSELASTQASVHAFGFAGMMEEWVKERNRVVGVQARGSKASVVIDTDVEMRRWFKRYAHVMKRRESQLRSLAEEAGGRVLLATSGDEFLERANQVSRDIGAQYVVTYTPRRPFSENGEDRRQIGVVSRRLGLQLISLRSYVLRGRDAIED